MELQVGVKILLKNPEGKYLLLHRSADKYPDVNDLWDMAGGRINPGSPLLENLAREIEEETKLRIEGEAQLIAAQDILRISERHVVRLTYIGRTSGEPVLDADHDLYRWLTLAEIEALPGVDSYLLDIVRAGKIH